MPAWEQQESRLVAEARRGDTSALDALAAHYRPWLYSLAFGWLRDPEAALDCIQEALLRLHQSLPRFREQCRFATWLYQILEHVCAEERRRREREARLPLLPWAETPDVHALLTRRADLHNALRALAGLPLPLRTTALLALLEGRPHAEVGGLLGISADAVKMRLSRARTLLAALPPTADPALDPRPLLAEGYGELASLLLRQRQERACGQALLSSLRLFPDGAYGVWAWQCLYRGTPLADMASRQTWRSLRTAAEQPGADMARLALANMHHWEGGDMATAIAIYTSLLPRQDSLGRAARTILGVVHTSRRQPREALRFLVMAAELEGYPISGYNLMAAARCLAQLRHPAAPEWVRRARVEAMAGCPSPGSPRHLAIHTGNFRARAAEACQELGDAENARKLTIAALQAYPRDYCAWDVAIQRLSRRCLGGDRPH